MIQRIQSVYLLLSALTLVLMFFFPFVEFVAPNDIIYNIDYAGIQSDIGDKTELQQRLIPVTVLLLLLPLFSLITIFLYNNRKMQVRISIYNIILMAGTAGMIFYFSYLATKQYTAAVHYSFPMILPVIAIIFTVLAIRAIQKDEKLVRSADRLR